jgi:hypothetical protein
MRISAFLILITLPVVVVGLPGCSRRLADSEYDILLAWLTCDHCVEGERPGVQSLGPKAVPHLASALKEVPELITAAARREVVKVWAPMITGDRDLFVQRQLDALEEMVRMRAAVSLGDLGAEWELRRALKDAEARGYGENLIRVIQGALQWAEYGGPVVAVVRVLPDSLTLPLGSLGGLAVSVTDEFGNRLELPLDWRSSDTSVVQVDMGGALTPVAPGSAFVVAEADGVSGQAAVTVVSDRPVPPRIHIFHGDHQQGLTAADLPERVRVQALAEDGTGVVGVLPEWSVLRGGGSVQPSSEPSDGSGVASAQWALGAWDEPQRLEARLPGSNAVVFRAMVVPGEARALLVVPVAAEVAVGGLLKLDAILMDDAGYEWPAASVSWWSADPAIATVSAGGMLVGVSPGTTRVDGTAAGLVGSADVLVVSPPAPPGGAWDRLKRLLLGWAGLHRHDDAGVLPAFPP